MLKNTAEIFCIYFLLIIYPIFICNSVFMHHIHSHYLLYSFVLKNQVQVFFSHFFMSQRIFWTISDNSKVWKKSLEQNISFTGDFCEEPFLQYSTVHFPNNFWNNFPWDKFVKINSPILVDKQFSLKVSNMWVQGKKNSLEHILDKISIKPKYNFTHTRIIFFQES